MHSDLPANTIARPYRGLSVQDVAITPREPQIMRWLLGRECYRRTEYLLLRNGAQLALSRITQAGGLDLFNPATAVDVLATGRQIEWIEAPGADVSNASVLAVTAARHRRPGVRAHAIRADRQLAHGW